MPSSVLAGSMWMPDVGDLAMLAPLWGLVATLVAVLIAALIVGRNWRVSGGITIVGALLTAWLSLSAWTGLTDNWAGMTPSAGSPMLVADQFSYFFVFLVSIFLALVSGMWLLGADTALPDRLTRKRDATEFFVLLIGSAFGMSLMVSTTNLLMIILAVEMTSLPSYGLAGFRKKHPLAAEASLKYILFGAVTSAIMIYGASLLYGQHHTLDLAAIGRSIAAPGAAAGSGVLVSVSLVAFMVGVAFKISAVPFHFWCPDVFEGASIEITTWLSVASKAAGLGLLLRIITVVTASGAYSTAAISNVTTTIAIMAAITCTVGNFSAFRQTNLKRLLAFSSIAHAGYMLMAVAIIWRPTGDPAGVAHPAFSVVIAYLTVYILMNVGAFGCVAMVYWATGKETIDGFNGLIRRSPAIAVVMVICLFSLVGLPPFGGFMAKWYLLAGLYEGGLVWLVIVAVFNTLISLYYYARVVYAMCFSDDGQPAIRTPLLGQVAVMACGVLIVLTGTLWAGKLKSFSDNRSRDLYAVVNRAPALQVVEPTAETAELQPTEARTETETAGSPDQEHALR